MLNSRPRIFMEKDIALPGFSGTKVILRRGVNGELIVRKIAVKIEQNDRLRRQYKKYVFFSKLKNKNFLSPQPTKSGFKKNLFFFEYEYIEGKTFLDFIRESSIGEVERLLGKVVDLMSYFSSIDNYYDKEGDGLDFSEALHQKILANSQKCNLNPRITERMLTKLSEIREINSKTLCHGDFTFDNIIIDKKEDLWLLDFTDIFYPHYWLDISKLFQDVDGDWTEIKYGIVLPEDKMSTIRNYLIEALENLDKEYLKHHNFFMSVVFLRLLPYTSGASEQKRIVRNIGRFLEI